MAQLLIDDISPVIIKRLKKQAELHSRSLQDELKSILNVGTKISMKEASKISGEWHKKLAGRSYSDSGSLIRKLRNY